MSWLRRVLPSGRRPPEVPSVVSDESTQPELVVEKRRRAQEHLRTDRLAKVIEDYRKQDTILRGR